MKNLQRLFKKASIETEVFLEIPFNLKTLQRPRSQTQTCENYDPLYDSSVYLRNLPFISFFALYFLVFELCTKHCTTLFQSCSINFFMYIIRNQNLTNDSPVVRLLAHKRLFAQLMVSFFSFNVIKTSIMNVVNTTKKTAFRVRLACVAGVKRGRGRGKLGVQNTALRGNSSFCAKNWN